MLLSSEEPVVGQFLNAQRVGPIGMSQERDADEHGVPRPGPGHDAQSGNDWLVDDLQTSPTAS